jgi:hypothetical protein
MICQLKSGGVLGITPASDDAKPKERYLNKSRCVEVLKSADKSNVRASVPPLAPKAGSGAVKRQVPQRGDAPAGGKRKRNKAQKTLEGRFLIRSKKRDSTA